jgi:hypothetical protein
LCQVVSHPEQHFLSLNFAGNHVAQQLLFAACSRVYEHNMDLELPMAVYCDHVIEEGRMRTDINTSFAFVASVIYSSVRNSPLCKERCTWLESLNETTLVNNPSRGRLKDWPQIL